MPKKKSSAKPAHPPDFCFVEQLRGENPPSFATMEALSKRALSLQALRPWELLEESELIVVRQPNNEGYCYCCVMGAVGQYFAMHAYLGADSYALFRRISSGAAIDPADFVASQSSVQVEFVRANELKPPDRTLLAALGFTQSRGALAPIFRASRPGYHPWFVTAEEAALIGACLHATFSICIEIVKTGTKKYWNRPGVYPLFVAEADSWSVRLIEPALPPEPMFPPAHLGPEDLARLRNRDYPVRGVIELDYFATMIAVGGKNERKAISGMALAADAPTGFLFPPSLTSPPNAGEALAKALSMAISAGNAFPAEVRVQSKKVKDCIAGVAEALSLPVRMVPRLPAVKEAREGVLELMARS